MSRARGASLRIRFPRLALSTSPVDGARIFLRLDFSQMVLQLAADFVRQQIDDRIEVLGFFLRGHREAPRFESNFATLPIFVDRENQMRFAGALQDLADDARTCAPRTAGSPRSARCGERSRSLRRRDAGDPAARRAGFASVARPRFPCPWSIFTHDAFARLRSETQPSLFAAAPTAGCPAPADTSPPCGGRY